MKARQAKLLCKFRGMETANVSQANVTAFGRYTLAGFTLEQMAKGYPRAPLIGNPMPETLTEVMECIEHKIGAMPCSTARSGILRTKPVPVLALRVPATIARRMT